MLAKTANVVQSVAHAVVANALHTPTIPVFYRTGFVDMRGTKQFLS